MPTSFDNQPELAPKDKIHFVEYHRPALKAGDYSIKVTQKIELTEQGIPETTLGDRKVEFSVQGERFTLKDREIHNVYPPENSNGSFHRVLPHIAFNRTTLPWERTPNAEKVEEILSPTWLALLLFTEDELVENELPKIEQKNINVGELKDSVDTPYWRSLHPESSQAKDEGVTVIDVPWGKLSATLPTYRDLKTMAHIRQVEPASKKTTSSEVAMVISNRLPPLDTDCTVHLVSLEKRYKKLEIKKDISSKNILEQNGYEIISLNKKNHCLPITLLKPFIDSPNLNLSEVKLETDKKIEYLQKNDILFTKLDKSKPESLTSVEWFQQSIEQNCRYLLQLANQQINDRVTAVNFDIWSDNIKQWLNIEINQTKIYSEGRTIKTLESSIQVNTIKTDKEKNKSRTFLPSTDSKLKQLIRKIFADDKQVKILLSAECIEVFSCLESSKEKQDAVNNLQKNTNENKVTQEQINSLIIDRDSLKSKKIVPDSYYIQISEQSNFIFQVSFYYQSTPNKVDSSEDRSDKLCAEIIKQRILSSKVAEDDNPQDMPVQNWISECFLDKEKIDRKATTLYLDPSYTSQSEADNKFGVYAEGIVNTSNIFALTDNSNIFKRLIKSYPNKEPDPDAFSEDVYLERTLEGLFNPYWHEQYSKKYRSSFNIIVSFPDSQNVLPLEINIQRIKNKDKNKERQSNYSSVRVSIRRSFTPLMVFDTPDNCEAQTLIRLVSLKHWAFRCQSEKRDFLSLFHSLNKVDLAAYYQPQKVTPELSPKIYNNSDKKLLKASYREPQNQSQDAKQEKSQAEILADSYIAAGYIPTPHHLRQGGKTISWYRGPLIPCWKATYAETHPISLPAKHADELLTFNREIGLFDASYAAAWELGRILALSNQSFANRLYQWKRSHPSKLKEVIHRIDCAYLPEIDQSRSQAILPQDIQAWLTNLSKLKQVPFNYLVPDEALLPPESIRFFVLDPLWLECLRDGALSIGRVLSSDRRMDCGLHKQLEQLPKISGVLVRSSVISGWPHLEVTGYPNLNDFEGIWQQNIYLPNEDKIDSLQIWRQERLAPDLLLVMFYDVAKNSDGSYRNQGLGYVDFHPHPQMMHFGLEEPDSSKSNDVISNENLVKRLRTIDGEQLMARNNKISSTAMFRKQDPKKGVLNLAALSEMIAEVVLRNTNQSLSFTAANFALQMLDSPPLVRFKFTES